MFCIIKFYSEVSVIRYRLVSEKCREVFRRLFVQSSAARAKSDYRAIGTVQQG